MEKKDGTKKAGKKNDMSFEKKIQNLENIVQKMEEGEMSLDYSLKAFEEGVKLSRECHEQLNLAEKKVQKLISIDGKGEPVTENY